MDTPVALTLRSLIANGPDEDKKRKVNGDIYK